MIGEAEIEHNYTQAIMSSEANVNPAGKTSSMLFEQDLAGSIYTMHADDT